MGKKLIDYAVTCKTEGQYKTIVGLFDQMGYKSGNSRKSDCSTLSGFWYVYKEATVITIYDCNEYISFTKEGFVTKDFEIVDFDYFVENILCERYNY